MRVSPLIGYFFLNVFDGLFMYLFLNIYFYFM